MNTCWKLITAFCLVTLFHGSAVIVFAAPIHDAVKADDLPKIESLLQDKANLDIEDAHGETPLLIAARFGRDKAASVLLAHGANIHAVNPWDESPLQLALMTYQNEINLILLKNLLQHGAAPNKLVWSEKATFIGGPTEVDVFRQLVEAGFKLTGKPVSRFRLLSQVAVHGTPESLRILSRSNDTKWAGNEIRIALGAAQKAGRMDSVTALSTSSDAGMAEGLIKAIYLKYSASIRKLLKSGVNPNAKNATGHTALHTAVKNLNYDFISESLKYHIDINMKQHGNNVLHTAVAIPDKRMVSFLAENGADLSAEDLLGRTPLDLAIIRKDKDMAEHLRSLGAPEGSTNKADSSVAQNIHAAQHPSPKTRKPFRQGASDSKLPPLYQAIDMNDTKGVKSLLNKNNRQYYNNFEPNPLEYAMYRKRYAITLLLVDLGADPNAANRYRITPLHLAAGLGHENLVRAMLKAGGNTEAKAENGMTPLFAAARHSLPVVKILVEAGANVDIRDNNGKTAADIAKDNNQQDIYNYLKSQ